MRSILVMAGANLRKRKAQALLIVLTILMSSLLLATAVGIMTNTDGPLAEVFSRQQGSQLTLLVSGSRQNPAEMAQWWQDQEGVAGVQLYPYVMYIENVRHNQDTQTMGDIMLTGHPGSPLTQDQLVVVEGGGSNAPGLKEIWLPTGYAYSWDIKAGDTMTFILKGQEHEFLVTAIVLDPQFSASMMSPTRLWINQDFLAETYGPEELNSIIGILFEDYNRYETLWFQFEEFLGSPFGGYPIDMDTVQYMYSFVESIIGVILLVFAGVIVLVSVFVIFFTINYAVVSDYKVIGILKAQGFSSRNIKEIYVLQYLLLAGIAIPLGVLLSKPVVGMVMEQMLRSLGIAGNNSSLLLPSIITLAVLMTIILVTAYISAAKGGAIKPAQAIRDAAPTKGVRKHQLDITRIKTLSVSLLLSLKNTLANRRHSIFLAAAAATMAFVVVFSVNIAHSMNSMGTDLAFWGLDNAEVYITKGSGSTLSHQEILDRLYQDSRVQAVVTNDVILGAIPAQEGKASKNAIVFLYGGDMDSIGAINLMGRNPLLTNEVSISALSAQYYNKTVGDTLELILEGEKLTFLITGVYQSVSGLGWSYKLQTAAIQAINPDFPVKEYFVKLTPGTDKEVFAQDMQQVLGRDFNFCTEGASSKLNLAAIGNGMGLVAIILSVIFMAVAFIITFNTTLMSIYAEKKNFGIYKALGMTPLQIRLSLVYKVLALSGIGILIGLPLSLFGSPRILGALIGSIGMMEFPFTVTVLGTLAAIPICLLVGLISAWIPSGRVLSLNPRNLIVD